MPGKLGHVMDDAQLTEQETVSIPDTVHKKRYLLNVHIKTQGAGFCRTSTSFTDGRGGCTSMRQTRARWYAHMAALLSQLTAHLALRLCFLLHTVASPGV